MISLDYFGMIICLAITFILCSLLYFYLNKKIVMLEETLLGQTELLRNIVARSYSQNPNQNLNLKKIDISDDEGEVNSNEESDESDSDQESDEESGEESDEESGEESDQESVDFDEQELNKDNIEIREDEVKVIEVEDLSGQNKDILSNEKESDVEIKELQIDHLEEESSISDNSSLLEKSVNEKKINLKKMNLNDLKQYAENLNVIEKGAKITKKNLLTLLEA